MSNLYFDLVVVGGGPAGMAAALAAHKKGVKSIAIIERDTELGGILNQCIHNGFGLHYFKEELTGPEYSARFVKEIAKTDIAVLTETMVLDISKNRELQIIGKSQGVKSIKAGAIVLAMGCRERARGAIRVPGTRPAGVITAGSAQHFVNIDGYMVGKKVVILGSGDIGLIMARRMTLEGAEVLACVELMPYSGGLTRNIVQCLNDFDIPLYLEHTVTETRGKNRLSGITIAKVDKNKQPIAGTEIDFDCDTLLLSVGLIPENELSKKAGVEIDKKTGGAVVFENMESSVEGVFACGNVAHVHDLVDYVTEESIRAGEAAAEFLAGNTEKAESINTKNGNGVSYVVPQRIRQNCQEAELFFRVNRVFEKGNILVKSGETVLHSVKRTFLAPGEMEKLKIFAEQISQANGELTIEVEAI